MKIIISENYKENLNIKYFNGENYEEILTSFKSLPKQKYEMEMFELIDHTGIALSFDNDLHIKMGNEDRGKFEKYFKIETHDHVMVDFKKLEARTHVATEDGSKGYKGLVTDLLAKHLRNTSKKVGNTKRHTIYACGPKPMLMAVGKLAKHYKIPCRVSLEEYMACGIGTCLGCAVKTRSSYKMVCKDGPVFDAKEIMWQI